MDPALELNGARRASGLTLRELARISGVNVSSISRIEAGTLEPTVAVLDRLLAACGRTLEVSHLARGLGAVPAGAPSVTDTVARHAGAILAVFDEFVAVQRSDAVAPGASDYEGVANLRLVRGHGTDWADDAAVEVFLLYDRSAALPLAHLVHLEADLRDLLGYSTHLLWNGGPTPGLATAVIDTVQIAALLPEE